MFIVRAIWLSGAQIKPSGSRKETIFKDDMFYVPKQVLVGAMVAGSRIIGSR